VAAAVRRSGRGQAAVCVWVGERKNSDPGSGTERVRG
jgi:hypothetical protein